LLFDGIAQNNHDKIWAGSIALAVLAMTINISLQGLERFVNPKRRIRRAVRMQQKNQQPSPAH
jgi:ABC-type proline/glycine betaine transport system permease subunit